MRRIAAAALAACLLVAAQAQDSSSQPTSAERVVFAVFDSSSIQGAEPGTFLDPVVLMNGSAMQPPPAPPPARDWQPTAAQRDFQKQYFAGGAEYPLYFGGERRGTVKVLAPKPVSCAALTATVEMSGLPQLQKADFALAIAGKPAESHASGRRAATPDELRWGLSYAQKVFRLKGTRRKAAYKVQALTVVKTDVDRDGDFELIGTYELAGPQTTKRLFMMLYDTGAGYQPLIAEFHEAPNTQLSENKTEMFVDQVDLSGDGIDELITRSFYYQRWDYAIYQRTPDGWKKVYSGGGGGC